MTSVAVAIASMGRPSLAQTLRSIAGQRLSPHVRLDVVVGDDGPAGAVQAIADDAPMPVRVVPAGRRNIAATRNATLDGAHGADWIAFIDDDEEAEPDWIAELLATAERYGADAVFGPIRPIYADDAPAWARRAGLYGKRPGDDGAVLKTGATGNALVRAAALDALRFREEFGQTGGEDTDLFARLANTGARLVASELGAVSERVPTERLRLAHLATRYTRGGHSYARIALEGRGLATRSRFLASAALKVAITSGGAVLLVPLAPHRAARLALRAWANRGKVLYALGRPAPSPYALPTAASAPA